MGLAQATSHASAASCKAPWKMFFLSMRSAVITSNVKSMKEFCLLGFFLLIVTGCYFSSWFPELCQWSVVLPGCSAGVAALCHAWAWLSLGWLSCGFFPDKARGSLAVMPAACLAQRYQVHTLVQGRQQGERINPSSFCAVLSMQLRHLPLLKCKWKFSIIYSLFLLLLLFTGT